jgi:hypothetical protein
MPLQTLLRIIDAREFGEMAGVLHPVDQAAQSEFVDQCLVGGQIESSVVSPRGNSGEKGSFSGRVRPVFAMGGGGAYPYPGCENPPGRIRCPAVTALVYINGRGVWPAVSTCPPEFEGEDSDYLVSIGTFA